MTINNETKKIIHQFRKAEIELVNEVQRPLLDEIRMLGYDINNISDLVNRYKYLTSDVINVLLDWLPNLSQHNVLEMAIRAIGGAKGKYEAVPLIKIFDNIEDHPACCEIDNKKWVVNNLRWVIGNTLSITKPVNIEKWLEKTLLNTEFGGSRGMLCSIAGKFLPYEKAIFILQSIMYELPADVPSGLGKIGKEQSVINFLCLHIHEIKEVILLEKYSSDCPYIPDSTIIITNNSKYWVNQKEYMVTPEYLRSQRLLLALKEIDKAIAKIERRVQKKK